MTYLNETETCELIRRLKTKNKSAFTDLYGNYATALYGVTYKMVCNRDITEDLLQDIFIKIWMHIDLYNPVKGTLFTWMLNITRNTCRDYFRSKNYRNQMMLSDNDLGEIDFINNPTLISYQDENRDLYHLTQNLEFKYKEIIDLVYFYGFTQEEVSKMLNIPIGTVKTRCRTALKILRDLYDNPIYK
jgi:RNA polymerase sigma-70 factor, ECF subfamily